MAVVGQLMVLITGNNAPLAASLASSQTQLKTFSATAGSAFVPVAGAAIAVGAAAGVGMGLAINAAADFEEQMAIINTIAHQTPAELAKTGEGIRALAVASGVGLDDLTQAYYDLLSAGIEPGAEAMDVLTQANTLAIGGLATTSQTVDLLTTAINAYGLDSAGAAVATDQFALAIQNGKLTAADIAATFADVAPLARLAGVGIDEIATAYGLITANGGQATDVATQMNRAILELMQPNKQLADLQEKTGLSFAEMAEDKGLVVALQAMRDAAEENDVPFDTLFGRIEGLKFALSTTGVFFDPYMTQLGDMGSATGTALGQAEERMGTFSRQMDILGTSINNLGISIGTGLLPFVTTLVGHLNGIVQGVTDWAEANPGLASSILPVITGVGLLSLAAIGVAAVVGALASPIVLFVLAVGIAVGLVMSNMDNLKAGIQAVIDWLNRMIELATIGAQTIHDLPGAVVDTARGGNIGRDPIGDFVFGTWGGKTPTTPGGAVGRAAFGGLSPDNRTPIQVNRTTNVHLDGLRIGRFVQKEMYNDASQASSGFARGELP